MENIGGIFTKYTEIDTFILNMFEICAEKEKACNISAKMTISKLIELLAFIINIKLIAGNQSSARE